MKIFSKKLALLSLGSFLFAQGCAIDQASKGNSEMVGKITVINEKGKDITNFCAVKNKQGLYVKKAIVGENPLGPITCNVGHYVYRIKQAKDITVNVKAENIAVYFGAITITLNNDGYSVTVNSNAGKDSYKGALPIEQATLSVGISETFWDKNFTGSMDGMF
jgi:hypothetical protein